MIQYTYSHASLKQTFYKIIVTLSTWDALFTIPNVEDHLERSGTAKGQGFGDFCCLHQKTQGGRIQD